jgi:FtsP/CotA-like multicopper oxidase with cupredoxin domain
MVGFALRAPDLSQSVESVASPVPNIHPSVHYFERRMFDDGVLKFSDGESVPYWGFNDPLNASSTRPIPSPVIRMREGEMAQVRLEMRKSSHAARTSSARAISNGAAPHGNVSVATYESSIYQWQPRSAGTWLYQNHTATPLDFEMGLFGLLVVDPEPDAQGRNLAFRHGPNYDREQIWVLDDVDPTWHTPEAIAHSVANTTTTDRAFDPKYFLINGVANTDALQHRDVAINAKCGERVLIRLLNASYSLLRVSFEHFQGDIISVDGTAIDTAACPWTSWIPVRPEKPLILATGSRHDVLIDLDPAKNPVEPGKRYRVVFEFLDLKRRCIRNASAQNELHVGRIVTTISVT